MMQVAHSAFLISEMASVKCRHRSQLHLSPEYGRVENMYLQLSEAVGVEGKEQRTKNQETFAQVGSTISEL